MPAAMTIHTVNRLAGILNSPDAPAAEDMIADAQARIDGLTGDLQAYVVDCVKQIIAIHAQGEEALFGESLVVGDLAMNIAEVCTGRKLEAIGEIARGIRTMIDSLVTLGVWHTDALNLHITSLDRLTGRDRPCEAEIERVLTDLRQMRHRIGAAD